MRWGRAHCGTIRGTGPPPLGYGGLDIGPNSPPPASRHPAAPYTAGPGAAPDAALGGKESWNGDYYSCSPTSAARRACAPHRRGSWRAPPPPPPPLPASHAGRGPRPASGTSPAPSQPPPAPPCPAAALDVGLDPPRRPPAGRWPPCSCLLPAP